VETYGLNIPCITLRDNTEWHVTTGSKANYLTGINTAKIERAVLDILKGKPARGKKIPLWDGKASERIAKVLCHRT